MISAKTTVIHRGEEKILHQVENEDEEYFKRRSLPLPY
jgi:hypothetical protein